ncbi:hypothetical protein [Nitratiruptor sp. SB155-2]|uniref:hypothetical protein n=1 Tax=Nitratiruptor sp. (strain SB155-2) TaxID=387092 RepID=UPI0002F09478|nr:hypothetical protein [Nitratiruptor sp. SB155-2]
MSEGKNFNILPRGSVEPTLFVEGLGTRTTKDKTVIIFDFMRQLTDNDVTIVSSVAITKNMARDIIYRIFDVFPELKDELKDE